MARTPPRGLNLIRAMRCWGRCLMGCCCLGYRQSQGRIPLGDRAWQGAGTDWQQPGRLSSTLCQRMGSRGCFSEKLLPPKVEYESGFGVTLITAGSIGSARPSKIQLQPWGPACSALRCLLSPPLPVSGEARTPRLQVLPSTCWPSTQPREVGPHPAHGASTPLAQP